MNTEPDDHLLIDDDDVTTNTAKFRRASLGTLRKIKEEADSIVARPPTQKIGIKELCRHLLKKKKPNGEAK